jgi:hypothetical protein
MRVAEYCHVRGKHGIAVKMGYAHFIEKAVQGTMATDVDSLNRRPS